MKTSIIMVNWLFSLALVGTVNDESPVWYTLLAVGWFGFASLLLKFGSKKEAEKLLNKIDKYFEKLITI